MKRIKTVADVQAVPATEFIMTANLVDGTCPFCDKKLRYQIVGFGRNKCKQYLPCSCLVARAAENHNELKEILDEEARECEQSKELEARDKRLQEDAQKPVTITAAQMFSVISGRVFPGIEPIVAEDVVGAAMHHAGFTKGSSKERLEEYAKKQGFADALKNASEKLLEFVTRPGTDWETNISGKISQLCETYNIPKMITL